MDNDFEKIAELVHEVLRAYCASIGDMSQEPWHEAPNEKKESTRAGVRAILNGEVTDPGGSHAAWTREKIEAGWSWGPQKDPIAKTHPCIVPFHDLPENQRMKDILFFNVVVGGCKSAFNIKNEIASWAKATGYTAMLQEQLRTFMKVVLKAPIPDNFEEILDDDFFADLLYEDLKDVPPSVLREHAIKVEEHKKDPTVARLSRIFEKSTYNARIPALLEARFKKMGLV